MKNLVKVAASIYRNCDGVKLFVIVIEAASKELAINRIINASELLSATYVIDSIIS